MVSPITVTFLRDTKENGGCTLVNPLKQFEGTVYVIGKSGYGLELDVEYFNRTELEKITDLFIRSNLLEHDGVGSWLFQGTLYLDCLVVTSNREEAIRLSKIHNQLAYAVGQVHNGVFEYENEYQL